MKDEFNYVVNNSKYVHIDSTKLEKFINDLGEINYVHWSKELNLDLNEKEWITLAFIIESMNFCFWKKPKWKIEYNNDLVSGSNALFYAIIKQVENDKNFLKIENLDDIDKDKFSELLKGVEGECPLIDKRFENFKEVVNFIKNNDFFAEIFSIKSDIELLNYITNNFSSFDDKSIYKGKTIHFNKRATLLTNDLYYLSETIRNNVGSVNNLSGCADYGIPRTFRDYGLLIYDDKLVKLIGNEEEIPHDSDMEIEIRGNMLYLIELIKDKLKDKDIIVNSVELDNLIWWMGKKIDCKSVAHHTMTIYY